jgi:hypothetical protein
VTSVTSEAVHPPVRRPPLRALIGAALILLLATAGWFVYDARRVHDGGPLQYDGGAGFGMPVHPGQAVWFGQFPLENTSDDPVVVDRVTFVDSGQALEVVGIYVRPWEYAQLGLAFGHAPPAHTHTPAGLVVRPSQDATYELMVGLSADQPGIYISRGGMLVEYHQGGRRFKAHLGNELGLCVASDLKTGCPDRWFP